MPFQWTLRFHVAPQHDVPYTYNAPPNTEKHVSRPVEVDTPHMDVHSMVSHAFPTGHWVHIQTDTWHRSSYFAFPMLPFPRLPPNWCTWIAMATSWRPHNTHHTVSPPDVHRFPPITPSTRGSSCTVTSGAITLPYTRLCLLHNDMVLLWTPPDPQRNKPGTMTVAFPVFVLREKLECMRQTQLQHAPRTDSIATKLFAVARHRSHHAPPHKKYGTF